MQRFCSARGVSDIYASTNSLHVLDLIGSDYTAFGIDCTAYLCNVSSDMYEYDTSTRLIRVQFIVQPSLEIATCLVYLSSWLRRLRTLPSGPTALTTGRRDRTGIFVFTWCDVRSKWRKENQILYCACKSTRSYSVGLQLRRHLFYCCTRIRPCWWLHTGSTQNSIIPTYYYCGIAVCSRRWGL